MVETPHELKLEPKLANVDDNELVDVVVNITLKLPGCLLATTQVFGETVRSDCEVSGKRTVVTLFGVRKQTIGGAVWLVQSDQTAVVEHAPPTLDNLFHIAETCAGIGAVDVGYQAAGASIVITNDNNPKFSQILHAKGHKVVLGSNHLRSVIARVAKSNPGCIAGGVSCQPFSKLGDQREGADPRSISLLGALQMIHYSQASLGLLECTPTAMESKWFQQQLDAFVQSTGFVCHQKIIELHECWPAKRTRWWCILARPELGIKAFPPLPTLDVKPNLFHLMPKLPQMSERDLQELKLDLYELRNFHEHGRGINQYETNFHKPLPTAVHSWGSQLRHCECGCRSTGFHPDRIKDKGLYGQLVRVEGMTGPVTHQFPNMRHLHPKEVALANGLIPSYVEDKPPNARLWLSAVGQLASPIQGLWVFANAMYDCHQEWKQPFPEPIQLLGMYIEKLFGERDHLLQITPESSNKYMQLFQQSWRRMYSSASESVPSPPPQIVTADEEPPKTDEITVACVARCKGKGVGSLAANQIRPREDEEILDDAIRQAVEKIETKRINETPEFQSGGVPGFAVKRSRSSSVPKPSKSAKTEMQSTRYAESPDESFGDSIRMTALDSPVFESPDAVGEPTSVPVQIHHQDAATITVRVAAETKMHQIVAAEESLGTLTPPITAAGVMGNPVNPQSTILPNDRIILHHGGLSPGRCPLEKANEPPKLMGAKRSQLLWKQEGWVAKDEFLFYARKMEAMFPQQVGMGIFPPDDPTGPVMIGEKILKMVEKSHSLGNRTVVDFILFKHHWTPISVEASEATAKIITTLNQGHWIQSMCQQSWGSSDLIFETSPIGQVFGADCGFQSVAWMIAQLEDRAGIPKMEIEQAIQWRQSFAESIEANATDCWIDKQLQLGGMQSVPEQLQQLVHQHGVATDRSKQCADDLIRSLGLSTIVGILKSPRPWSDLKARANLHSPPIRVVLASELQEAIKSRVQQGVVGSKHTKAKKRVEQTEVFQLQAKQIAIPHAVFKQEDGNEISQIQQSQINGTCRGVLIVNANEALPYCHLTQPVSKEGVALLVPDHDDPRLPEHKEIIKVPAQCVATKEPIIATMAMLQIGAQTVSRNLPQQCVVIEEVANTVMRVAVYRDQYPEEWEGFINSPVKQLLAMPVLSDLDPNCILDVWDRQFLNLRLSKEVPKDACVFMVNLRIHHDQVKVFQEADAKDGVYTEPRNNNGRQPCENYQVVWLPKKNFAEAQVSNQMTKVQSALVRSGNRYGLRVSHADAQQVHQEHRPDVTYLDGSELRKYRVGPLPYGSTKQSIVNAFKKWGWTARPLGPQGQSKDKSGTMWLVQAASPPTHWIFQMQHGDVLISTDVTSEAQPNQVPQPSVIASSKTLQSLKSDSSSIGEIKDKVDPWTHKDPWQAYNNRELSVGQVNKMQAHLEAKIDQRLKESRPMSEDSSMNDDAETRINSLEAQVQQLTGTFQTFQQQQTQHNHGMYSQLKTLDKQMHEQHKSLSNVLDSKLEDQMMRIEALLTKRSRTE